MLYDNPLICGWLDGRSSKSFILPHPMIMQESTCSIIDIFTQTIRSQLAKSVELEEST